MSIDDQAGDAEKILNSVECAHNRLIDEIGTLSVYISSPYKDLLPYRLKAAKAVRELEYRPIGMEDYVACDERPLLKCLGDVQGSDVYVGILARRYGHRDPGDSISITHHEYRAAKDRDIPRLLFKLDPRCSWPKKFIDDDQSLVKEFVAEWEADRVVKTFTTPDDLGRAVATSLANLARSRTRH
ncbi:MAG: DUF4062 domain-containing protein [Planctomycetota bacterium]|nr:DUF4062 domain-containing protein [Planctomycetota bacterium]